MTLVLRDASIVDIDGRRIHPRRSVHIDDGMITRIVATDEEAARYETAPDGEREDGIDILDCGGRYLLPGLTDAHVHLRATSHGGPHSDLGRRLESSVSSLDDLIPVLHGYLYCGVTSLYDAGNFSSVIWPLREEERGGRIVSPRIHCAGPFVTCSGGHGSELAEHVSVDALPADEARLRHHLGHRPDLVKITYDEHNWGIRPLIPILPLEVLRGIIDVAHDEGLRVMVHVSNELRAREAVDCGADVLAHPVIQSPITDAFIARLASEEVPVVSTLAIGERYVRLADDPDFLDGEMYVRCVAPGERQRLKTTEHEAQRANRWADWMRVMTPVAQENLCRLVEAGGTVVSGSDLSLGPDLLRELELLQDAGIDPWDVLTCATVNATRCLDTGEHMGAVAAGKVADLVLVDEDPTTDVSRLSGIAMVMKGGQVIDRSRLELAGERPPRSDTAPYSPLSA